MTDPQRRSAASPEDSARASPDGKPRQSLNLLDVTCIIVGIVIGAGIFESSPNIAANAGSIQGVYLVWLAGGLLVLMGALCYAELTTTYPEDGGDYIFLRRAYGRGVGFLFAWAEFWVIRPCSIGAMAFVFASFAEPVVPIQPTLQQLGLSAKGAESFGLLTFACAATVCLTAVNALGVQVGKWTQNALTLLKVAGLLVVVAVALIWLAPNANSAANSASDLTLTPSAAADGSESSSPSSSLRLALILVLWTYGGWNEMSYVAAEVRHPRKNMFRSLVFGTIAVTAIYLLANYAFLHGLGYEGLAASDAVAVDLLQPIGGRAGGVAISLLICVSSLGAMNGMMFTGPRIFYALGEQHPAFERLGKWNARFDTPLRALLWQSVVVILLMISFGWYGEGFQRLVLFSAPFFWSFLCLVAVSVIVLRWRDPGRERAVRVFLYPVTPLVFFASTVFMLYASIDYLLFIRVQSPEGLWEGLWAALVVASAPVAWLVDRRIGRKRQHE